MKIIKSSVPVIKQIILDSHRKKASLDTIFQLKEKSRGRGQGVFITRVLGNGEVYFKYFVDGKEKSKKIGRYGNTEVRQSSRTNQTFLNITTKILSWNRKGCAQKIRFKEEGTQEKEGSLNVAWFFKKI